MALSTDELVLYSILIFILLENAIEIYLSLRQVKVYKETKEIPKQLKDVMKMETFEQARIYGLDKAEFSIIKAIVMDMIILSLEMYLGFLACVWHKSQTLTERIGLDPTNEISVSCVFIIVINLINLFKEIPFKIYGSFVLEEKHGFNKQTPMFFFKDQLKSFVVGQIISLPLAAAVIFIIQKGGDYFFVWLWMFTGVVCLLMITIYPVLIAPLFDKYRPLDQGPLRKSIENLSASLKFPLAQLYVVEGSKRSAHSNAYFYGLWGSKRIVLFDTLLLNKGQKDIDPLDEYVGKGCDDSEVLAVLAHELGHWKLGHITKNIIFMQVHLFLMFAAFAYLFKYDPLYQAVGFHKGERPILVGLLLILMYVLAAYNAIINFGMTIISRAFEYQADAFAMKLGYSKELGKALVKLNIDNLGFPVYDWMYSAWNHSHPTLLQRMERLVDGKKTD